jgi:hypothetical protein
MTVNHPLNVDKYLIIKDIIIDTLKYNRGERDG